jgi:hypothetical protein
MLVNEQAIYRLFKEERRLDDEKRDKALRFLEQAFLIFKDETTFRTEIIEKCR